ncbi:class B acid phosphatase, partial [Escherichia coli]|nr:class B acid phosphatase [Escherichia coli]
MQRIHHNKRKINVSLHRVINIFYTKKDRNVFTGLNIIILLFITKTADNPSFPRRLALWSDG